MMKAILFDMDGVLVDSEPVHFQNVRQALKNQGVELGEQEFYAHWTREGKDIVQFASKRGIVVDRDRYRRDKQAAYPDLIRRHLRLMPHARETLERLSGSYKLALVSSSGKEEIRLILEHFKLAHYFKEIIGCEDAKRPKPAPDAFLLAAKKLGVKPEECVVIEDAWKGIEAAKAANMKAIAIPNSGTKDNDFSKADIVINNLSELIPSMIG